MTFLQMGPRYLGQEMEEAMVPDDAFSCASKLEERLGPLSPLVEWRRDPRSILSPDNSRTYADQK